MHFILRQDTLDRLGNILILFILYGSIFVSFLPTLLGIPPAIPLYANYLVIVFLSVLVIFFGSITHRFSVRVADIAPLCLFLLLYVYRLVDNLYIDRVFTVTFPEPFTYFLYLFVLNVIPCLAICFCKGIDFDFLFRWGYRVMLIILLLSFWYNLVSGIEKTSNLRNTGNDVIGALSYGHYGVTFSIMSLIYITKTVGTKKFLYIGGYLFGLFAMYLSGSRSPLLALFICTVVYLFGSNGLLRGTFLIVLLVLPFAIFWDQIVDWLSTFHSGFIQRVLLSLETGDSSGRDVIYDEMIRQIFQHPFFGRYFVVKSGEFMGYYPHNMILEAVGATGLFGGFFFIRWMVTMVVRAISFINTKDQRVWVALLFLQYLLFGMSSKALYTNTSFWYYAFILMVIYKASNKFRNLEKL